MKLSRVLFSHRVSTGFYAGFSKFFLRVFRSSSLLRYKTDRRGITYWESSLFERLQLWEEQ